MGVVGLALLVLAGCRRPEVGASARMGDVSVRRAVAWTMGEAHSATAGFEVDIAGGAADTLVAVTSLAGRAGLHATKSATGSGMQELASLALPPGRTVLDGRAVHLMVQDMPADIPIGGRLPLELRFARAGTMRLDVPVLQFSDALAALGR